MIDYQAEILVVNDRYNVVVRGDVSLNVVGPTVDERGNPAVSFGFNNEGANRFQQLTSEFQPKPDGYKYHLAVVLNGRVSSAPTINAVIGASGIITGYRSDVNGRKERDRVIAVQQVLLAGFNFLAAERLADVRTLYV